MEQQGGGGAVLAYAGAGVEGASRRGKGFLAVAATLAVPGLGQFIAGARRRGAGWFVASVGIGVAQWVLMAAHGWWLVALGVLVPVGFGVALWCLVDAYLVGNRRGGRMLGRAWARYLAGVGILVAAAVGQPQTRAAAATRARWAEAYVMPTAAMAPTLVPGDRFLVSKRVRTWRRWDVVALWAPDQPAGSAPTTYCKRIVGLPGETVEIRGGVVHVNGSPVAGPAGVGPYLTPPVSGAVYGTEGHPVTLGADEYFLLGDNSLRSGDSRYWREHVTEGMLIGHVTAIYWPVRRARILW